MPNPTLAAPSAAQAPAQANSPTPRAQAVRHFGRFQLLKLLGKSERSILWQAEVPDEGRVTLLAMPRARPTDAAAAERWRHAAHRAARLNHPALAPVIEAGEHEHWPFVRYDLGSASVLSGLLGSKGQPAQTVVPWALQVLQGLAFAHDAGLAHHDLQTFMVLIPEQGSAQLLGLGVAYEPIDRDVAGLHALRRASERDVLALGIVMHHALAGQAPLDQTDASAVIERLPPLGRDILRLPWTTTHKVPEALRAIVNRATDRQERHRYRNARTVERALEGWLKAEGEQGAGPLALLQDRMRSAGLLPVMPGGAQRAARMALMERGRNDELAEVVLQDVALSFELMRSVNASQLRSGQSSVNGPVLTMRRAIDMLGIDGVRRVALSLRAWPGPLNEAQAAELERLIERVRRAGRVAQALRPAGYDAEVVLLLTLLQNLGRLVVRYHFADDAAQIDRLMKPAPAARAGEAEDPGMSEEAASFAVLGIDIAAIGAALARQWGLDDSVLQMIQRIAPTAPVRGGDSDQDLLRLTACCANEAIDTTTLPVHHQASALLRVVQRYGRALRVTLPDVQQALAGASAPVSRATSAGETEHLSPA